MSFFVQRLPVYPRDCGRGGYRRAGRRRSGAYRRGRRRIVRLFERDGQPFAADVARDAAEQYPQHPDRLSAPREAGLDGRYLYDRPDGDLQFRYGGFLCEMGDRPGRYGRPERRTVHRGAVDRVRPEHFDRVAGRYRVRAVGSAVLLRRPPRGGAALRNDEAFRRKQPAASGGRQAGDHPRGARRLGVAAHDVVRYAAIL